MSAQKAIDHRGIRRKALRLLSEEEKTAALKLWNELKDAIDDNVIENGYQITQKLYETFKKVRDEIRKLSEAAQTVVEGTLQRIRTNFSWKEFSVNQRAKKGTLTGKELSKWQAKKRATLKMYQDKYRKIWGFQIADKMVSLIRENYLDEFLNHVETRINSSVLRTERGTNAQLGIVKMITERLTIGAKFHHKSLKYAEFIEKVYSENKEVIDNIRANYLGYLDSHLKHGILMDVSTDKDWKIFDSYKTVCDTVPSFDDFNELVISLSQ